MRRRKKGAGLKRLVELAGMPEPKKDVIKVEAVPIVSAFDGPIERGHGPMPTVIAGPHPDEIVVPLLGNLGLPAPAMKYTVETDGVDYKDRRGMAYQENQDGSWKMQVMWSANGSNGMPHGFKILGKMAQFFNFAANMMIGGDVEVQDQRINQETAALPPPPEEPMHMKVLGYLQGKRDKPC